MKAQQLHAIEGPDGLRLVDVPEPEPADGEVVIDVRAAGVTFPELLFSRGTYQFSHPLPFTLGSEVAGVVRAAPEGSGVAPGDRVAALTILGGFAEVVACPPEQVVPLPDGMGFAEGAAVPVNYLTALFGLVTRGRLAAGETVLVQGAAGGLGSAAVQTARALGGRVIAVVSSEAKARLADQAGADEVVRLSDTWRSEVVERSGGGVDLVFDPVGGERFTDNLRALRPGGRALVVGFAGGDIPIVKVNRLLLRNIDVVGVSLSAWMHVHPEITAQLRDRLATLLHDAAVAPVVGQRFALADASEALRAMEERRAVGKVVLDV